MRVAVVGAGVAGLAAASALSDQGHVVVVYEATDTVGGDAAGTLVLPDFTNVRRLLRRDVGRNVGLLPPERGAGESAVVGDHGFFDALWRVASLRLGTAVTLARVGAYIVGVDPGGGASPIGAADTARLVEGDYARTTRGSQLSVAALAAILTRSFMWSPREPVARLTPATLDAWREALEWRRGVTFRLDTPVTAVVPAAGGGDGVSVDGERYDGAVITAGPRGTAALYGRHGCDGAACVVVAGRHVDASYGVPSSEAAAESALRAVGADADPHLLMSGLRMGIILLVVLVVAAVITWAIPVP